MEINRCVKEPFSVIGKEGSTDDGEGFIQRLWNEANSHFAEIEHLAKKDEAGNISGIWGVMSDFSHSFKPWEEKYSKGVYLAGVEAIDGAKAPEGWTKWTIPGYEYLYVKCTEEKSLEAMYGQLRSFKHDYINILTSMSGYIEKGDMEELKVFLKKKSNQQEL